MVRRVRRAESGVVVLVVCGVAVASICRVAGGEGCSVMTPDMRILSLGAGRQSTALFILGCEGVLLPKLDAAVFAARGTRMLLWGSPPRKAARGCSPYGCRSGDAT